MAPLKTFTGHLRWTEVRAEPRRIPPPWAGAAQDAWRQRVHGVLIGVLLTHWVLLFVLLFGMEFTKLGSGWSNPFVMTLFISLFPHQFIFILLGRVLARMLAWVSWKAHIAWKIMRGRTEDFPEVQEALERTWRVPVRLHLDAEAHPPVLRWTPDMSQATVMEERHVEEVPHAQAPAPEAGAATLARGRVGFDLTRSPSDPSQAALTLRALDGTHKLTLALPPEASRAALAHGEVPALTLEALTMDSGEGAALLEELGALVDLQGLSWPLPVAVGADERARGR